jgi:hypothetical protein
MKTIALAFLILVLSTARLSAQGSFLRGQDDPYSRRSAGRRRLRYLRPHVGNLHGQVYPRQPHADGTKHAWSVEHDYPELWLQRRQARRPDLRIDLTVTLL